MNYNFSVFWSCEDNEFVATVDKFPLLSWVDVNPVAALAGLVELVDSVSCDIQSHD